MCSRQGAHLSEEKRKEYEQLMNTIIEKQNEFSKNLAEEKTELRFKEKDLKGVPETTMSGFRRDGEDFIVTMKYPDVMPIMDHCDVEETRRIVLTAFNSRGGPKNLALLEETIKLRQKAAVLLGYPDFPTYKLETEMAENPQNVKSFLTDLRAKLTERGKEEVRELTELKHATGGEGSMQAWDFSYYMTLLKEKKFDVNEEEIQQYLPTEHVIKEMMKIYEEIFGLSFKEYVWVCFVRCVGVRAGIVNASFITSLTIHQLTPHRIDYDDKWFDEVKAYSVYNADGSMQGLFFLDLYPRDGKYTHACVQDIQSSSIFDGEHNVLLSLAPHT